MKVALEGHGAIVTGGANGIGKAIAHALVENGAPVAIVDIDAQAGKQTAQEIHQTGGTCIFIEADVANPEQMEVAAQNIAAQLGGIQILINNAGINTKSDRVPIHQYTLDDCICLLYTSPSPRDRTRSRMPSSA